MTPTEAAAKWMTEKVAHLFYVEIANERNGGVSPATLASAIDSVSQAPDIMCEGWTTEDWVSLLYVVNLVGSDAELDDILRAKRLPVPPS